jgi:hypothetical protein
MNYIIFTVRMPFFAILIFKHWGHLGPQEHEQQTTR